jgi:hypothetical protein
LNSSSIALVRKVLVVEIDIALVRKVLVVEIDFKMVEYSGNNHILSIFVNQQKQHYHVYLIIDGDIVQNPRKLLK